MRGHPTPEAAAQDEVPFPQRYERVLFVDISPDGRDALVFLATEADTSVALQFDRYYTAHCHREEDRWELASGGAGIEGGWTTTSGLGTRKNVGVLHLGGQVPPGVREVVVRWQEEEHRVPVTDGYFFFVRWDVPADFDVRDEDPEVIGFIRDDD